MIDVHIILLLCSIFDKAPPHGNPDQARTSIPSPGERYFNATHHFMPGHKYRFIGPGFWRRHVTRGIPANNAVPIIELLFVSVAALSQFRILGQPTRGISLSLSSKANVMRLRVRG